MVDEIINDNDTEREQKSSMPTKNKGKEIKRKKKLSKLGQEYLNWHKEAENNNLLVP